MGLLNTETSGETTGGAMSIIFPEIMTIKKSKTSFIQNIAGNIFANINFDSSKKSIKENAEESVKKAVTLVETLESQDYKFE